MAAPTRDPAPEAPDVLAPASSVVRSRLGIAITVVGMLAVVLAAADAPAAVRAPVVLLAALTLPGYPLAVRLPVDLPTLLAIDVVVSLSLEAAGALLTVETRLWHPMVLGLALAAFGVGGTLVRLVHVRHDEARHLQ